MRNYSKTVGALAAASTLVAGYASAEIEGEVHVGYSNMYEFRFVDLGNDLVEAGVDIATEMNGFGLSAGAWYASFDQPNVFTSTLNTLGLPGGNSNADELDLYAAASYSFDRFTLELGYIYYYFPDGGGNTQEVYLGASAEIFAGIGFGTTFYYDFDANNGWYSDTQLTYSIAFNDCLALDLAAGVGFANGNQLQVNAVNPWKSKDGFQGYYLSAALPWSPIENLTISPYVKYTNGDDKLVTDLYGNSDQDYLIGGVNVAVSF